MEVHAWNLVRTLARRHRLSVLVPRHPQPPPLEGVTLAPLLTRRYRGSLARAAAFCAAHRADAVLVLNAGYAALGGRLDVPVVARVVGNDFERAWIGPHLPGRFLFWRLPVPGPMGLGGRLRRADQALRNRAAAAGLRSCGAVLANSTWTREALRRAGVTGPALHVIPGGVDLDHFRPGDPEPERIALGLPPGAPILFSAARFTRKKGFDLLLRVLPKLAAEHAGILLLLAGRGEEEEALRAEARRLQLEDRVRFLGTVEHALLPRYMAAADLYLQPSRSALDARDGSVDVETMGRAVCEAAACGRAAIVSRSGGLPDIVEDGVTGLVVPEEDAAALAAGIGRLLGDAALRRQFGAAAADRARRLFGWETVARRTDEAIAAACAARPRSA